MSDAEARRLRSRIHGTLLGAAVADALAYPFQSYSRSFLQSVARPLTAAYEPHGHGHHPGGQPTDDTQTMLAVVDALLERDDDGLSRRPSTGRAPDASTPSLIEDEDPRSREGPPTRPDESLVDESVRELVLDFLVPLWRDLTIVDADPETTEAVQQVVRGVVPWSRAALPVGRASSGALTRAIPIGLLLTESPELVVPNVRRIVSLTHEDPRVISTAAGIAAAVAFFASHDEIILGHLLDRVSAACAVDCPEIAAAVEDLPRILSQTDPRALRLILDVLRDPEYPPREDGLGEYCVPVLLVSLHAALKSPTDWSRAVDRVLRLGGNVATTAAVTAALVGAHLGHESVPEHLVEELVDGWETRRRADEFSELALLRARAAPSRGSAGAEDCDEPELENGTEDGSEDDTDSQLRSAPSRSTDG